MRRLRVYLDTSVFGGIEDRKFAVASRRVFELARRRRFVIVLSAETLRELRTAPEAVRRILHELPEACLERLAVDAEMEALAEAYIQAGILTENSRSDALHVAAATLAEADLVLSWNFKHIVRYDRIRMFNGINVLRGYRPVDIRSPLEFAYGDEDQEAL